jgi:hypothetical protein
MNDADLYIIDCIKLHKKYSGIKVATLGGASMSLTALYSIATNTDIPLCRCGNQVELYNTKNGYRKYCSTDCYKQDMVDRNKSSDYKNNIKDKLKNNALKNKSKKIDLYNDAINFYKNNNYTIAYVAKKFDLDYQSFKNILHDMNIFDKDKNISGNNKMEWTNNHIDMYINDYIKNELTAKEISVLAQCSPNYVITYLRSKNIKLKQKNVSSHERKIRSLLDDLNVKYIENDRIIIGIEVDLYLPDYNLCIEVNGLYWHDGLDHQYKYELCKYKNIKLLQFNDKEINEKFDIVSSIILYNLNMITNKIHARSCYIKEIDYNQYYDFVCLNSLYDPLISESYIGLFHNDKIVYILGYSGDTINDIVPLKNTIINGGFTKLIKYINAKNIEIDSLIFSNKLYQDYQFIKKETVINGFLYKSSGIYMSNITAHISKSNIFDIDRSNINKIKSFLDSINIKYKLSNINTLYDEYAVFETEKLQIRYVNSMMYKKDYTKQFNLPGIPRNYFINITKLNKEQNIRTIWIKDWELINEVKWNVLQSYIKTATGNIEYRIYARDCEIKILSNKDVKPFLENNSFYGHRNAALNIGLILKKDINHLKKGDLVFVYTFGHPFFSKKYDIEVIRVASLLNTQIIGGSSKCLKYFLTNYTVLNIGKKEVTCENILFLVDADHNDGKSLERLNYKFISHNSQGFMNMYVDTKEVFMRNPRQYKNILDLIENGSVITIENAGTYVYSIKRSEYLKNIN